MDLTLADELRERFLAADYTTDGVLERIGDAGQRGLGRNQTIPALTALGTARDAQAILIKLWLLQQILPLEEAAEVLPVSTLTREGVLASTGNVVRAAIDIRPYGSDDDGAGGWVASDLTPGMDGIVTRTRPDYVLGVSPASTTLAQLTMRTPVGAALDLGTGCGVQSLHLARHASRVVATDVNRRALDLAQLTMALNGVQVDVREGSLYEPVTDERFDLIVTNPPYVMSPPTTDTDRLVYREGGFEGDGLVRAVVTGAPAHLTEGGSLQVLGNWAITAEQPWEERLAGWAEGTGCDLWVIERERMDPFEYIELWLTDAGLAGAPDWADRYREWLDYFERLGITGVGMGWLQLTRAERDVPDIRIESWPHAVHQPVGQVFAAHQDAVTASRLPDAELLRRRLRLVEHVDEETIGRPGEADPEHVVLRSRTGLGRAMKVGTLVGGVLGACDGDLTLGEIISAVADILGVPETDATAETLPEVRTALADGLLHDPRR